MFQTCGYCYPLVVREPSTRVREAMIMQVLHCPLLPRDRLASAYPEAIWCDGWPPGPVTDDQCRIGAVYHGARLRGAPSDPSDDRHHVRGEPQSRRTRRPLEIRTKGLAGDRRKTPLFWARIEHKQTSCDLYGIDCTRILFYQRLTRGLSFFRKIQVRSLSEKYSLTNQ